MSDKPGRSVLDKYNIGSKSADAEAPEAEQRAFSILRGVGKHLLMLELRRKTGDCVGLGYSYFAGMEFDASGVLVLYFTTHKVTVRGRNLRPVYEGLLDHSVGFLQEEDERYNDVPEGETVITSILAEKYD